MFEFEGISKKQFDAIMEKPPHILDRTEANFFGAYYTSFHPSFPTEKVENGSTTSARTELLNGRTVAIFEGQTELASEDRAPLQQRFYSVLFADVAHNSAVGKIYFAAPEESFGRYYIDVRSALNSIRWTK